MKVIDMFVQKAATRRWEARVRGSPGPRGGNTTIDEADQWGRRRGKGEGLLNDGTNTFSPPECRCVDTVGLRSRQNERQLKTKPMLLNRSDFIAHKHFYSCLFLNG